MTYSTHFFSATASGNSNTICNQRSKWQGQNVTNKPAEVTCKKCLLLLNAGTSTAAKTPAQVAAAEKKLRAAQRELKTAQKDLEFFQKKGVPTILPGETRETAFARIEENYRHSVLVAQNALAKLESAAA